MLILVRLWKLTRNEPQIHVDPVLMFDYLPYVKPIDKKDYIIIYTYPNRVLQIHYRKLATDKQNSVAVVEHSHFIRGKHLTTGNLIIVRVVSAPPLAFPVGVRINRFLA